MPMEGELCNLEPESIPTAQVFAKMKYWFIIVIEFPKGKSDLDLRNRCIEWVRDVYKLIEPFSTQDKGREKDFEYEFGDIYGDNMSRLRKLKGKYDPDNIFSLNRNILPLHMSDLGVEESRRSKSNGRKKNSFVKESK